MRLSNTQRAVLAGLPPILKRSKKGALSERVRAAIQRLSMLGIIYPRLVVNSAAQISEKYDGDYIKEKLTLFEFLKRTDPEFAENPAGFLISAIEQDYRAPKKHAVSEPKQPKLKLAKRPKPALEIETDDGFTEEVQKMTDNERADLLEVALTKAPKLLRDLYEEKKASGGRQLEVYRNQILVEFLRKQGRGVANG